MTTITLPRATVEQALEALKNFERFRQMMSDGPDASDKLLAEDYAEMAFVQGFQSITKLEAALAQQAEPVEPVGTKALTHEAIADALSKGAPLAGDQRAVLLGLVADDKVWQRECDRLQAELAALRAAPPEQAEPVSADAAYQRWLEDTHAPALRRMDSQGAFAAGWQAAMAQQAEPVQDLIPPESLFVCDQMGAHVTRVRLAQQAEPVEPVAWVGDPSTQDYASTQPDPVEPVGAAGLFTLAHLWAQQCYFKGLGRPCDIDSARGAFEQALKAYTAPPQRKPLTDEEIDRIFEHLCNSVGASCKTMARAVERAHKIGEEK